MWQATESPNGRWICYNQAPLSADHSVLYLLPARGGTPRRLLDHAAWDDKPRWSPNGRLLYFLSTQDGGLNVWAVGMDPDRGTTLGTPWPVTAYNGVDEALADHIGGAELSVAGGRLAMLVERRTGGIWTLE